MVSVSGEAAVASKAPICVGDVPETMTSEVDSGQRSSKRKRSGMSK